MASIGFFSEIAPSKAKRPIYEVEERIEHQTHKILLGLVIGIGALVSFIWFCGALINCIQAYSSGYYADHRLEQVLETTGLVMYSYCGFRFSRNKIATMP